MTKIEPPPFVEFFVNVDPVAQPRPKATRMGKGVRVYNPDNGVLGFKEAVKRIASAHYRGIDPELGPVSVDIEFFFSRTKAQTWKRKPMTRLYHTKKPDRDNLDKAVLDALSGLAYRDDAQVCAGRVTKWICSGDDTPGALVRITYLPKEPAELCTPT